MKFRIKSLYNAGSCLSVKKCKVQMCKFSSRYCGVKVLPHSGNPLSGQLLSNVNTHRVVGISSQIHSMPDDGDDHKSLGYLSPSLKPFYQIVPRN